MRASERASRLPFGSSWLDCQAQVIAINFFVRGGNLRNRTNKARRAVRPLFACTSSHVALAPSFRPFPRSVHVYLDCGWNKIQQPSRTHAARPPCSCSPDRGTDGHPDCVMTMELWARLQRRPLKSHSCISHPATEYEEVIYRFCKKFANEPTGAVSEIKIGLPLCIPAKLSLVP